MDSITTAPQTVPAWPLSYRGRGFWIVQLDDGTYEAHIQGGYRTTPTLLTGQALQLVKDLIDAQEAK